MSQATATKFPLARLEFYLIRLTATLLLVLTLFFAAFIVLQNSPSRLAFVLEEAGGWLLGRELQIGELLEADLNWDVYLLARDVSLANPEWAQEPEFARVGRLLIRINIPSLWRDGPVLIDELVLDDAQLNLQGAGKYPANWVLHPVAGEGERADSEAHFKDETGLVFPVRIVNGRVGNGELLYRDSRRDIALSIEELALQEPGGNSMFTLKMAGSINNFPLHVEGNLGPSVALLTRRDLSMDLAIVLGELSLKARGSIDDLNTLTGPDLHLEISAPRGRPLLSLLGVTESGEGSLNLRAHLTNAHPGMAVDVVGALDEIDMQVSGKLLKPLELEGVELDFNFDGPSVSEIGTMFGVDGLPDGPYHSSGVIIRDAAGLGLRNGVLRVGDGRLAVEGRLPYFPEIDDWELALNGESFNLAVLGAMLGIHGLPNVPYDIKGNLGSTEEGVELLGLEIRGSNTQLVLTGSVGEAPEYLGSRIKLKIAGDKLASIGPWLGFYTLPDVPFELNGQLVFDHQGWHLSDAMFISAGLEVNLKGQADKLPEPTRLAARVELSSPNLVELFHNFNVVAYGLPPVPVVLKGAVSGPPGALKIDEMNVFSGESRMNVSGMLGDLVTGESVNLAMAFTSPDLLTFFPDRIGGSSAQLPVDVETRVLLSGDGFGIKDLQGSFGGATIAVTGFFNLAPPFNNSHFSLQANGPDLNQVVKPWLDRGGLPQPFSLSTDAIFDAGGVQVKRLEATVAGARLRAEISMADLGDPATARGSFKLAGPSSLQLVNFLGLDFDMPDSDYSLDIGIRSSNDSLHLDPIALNWGKGDLDGHIVYRPGKISTLDADLHSGFVNLPFLIPDSEELARRELEAAKAAASGQSEDMLSTAPLSKEEMARRVIPDEPLDFGWLNTLQGSFKYSVDEIYLSEGASSSAIVDVTLTNGVLSSRRIKWNGSFASGDIDLSIRPLKEGAEIGLGVDFNRLPILLMLGGEPKYDKDAMYRARIKSTGGSWRDLAQNANGALIFKAGGGRMENTGTGLILGDFMEEMLRRLNPFKETDRYTKIICHAGAMSIVNGKAAIVPGLVIRSKKLDVALAGDLNLRNEEIDLTFSTRSRKGVGISAGKAITPYFKLGGILANPRLVLDPKGVALSGGAAVATGGISILAESLWDRWVVTASNPCKKVFTSVSKGNNEALKALLAASPVAAVAPQIQE